LEEILVMKCLNNWNIYYLYFQLPTFYFQYLLQVTIHYYLALLD